MTPARGGPGLIVIKAGLQTTVQDRGRWGFQSFGVSVAGSMDLRAYRIANARVGNGPAAAAVEVPLVGHELEFEDPRRVSGAGATVDIAVGGSLGAASTD